MSNYKPRKYRTNPPQPPSLSSLPDEIVLRCLALVPRSYHLSLSWVSKNIRSLVHSSEFKGLRSVPHKSSLYLCFQEDDVTSHWFTLRPTEETATTEYRLIPNPTPFSPHKYGSSTVVVGSTIYFIGGSREPSTDLWILDTQSGNITQGPSMTVPRVVHKSAVGLIDGKIYVMGGGGGFNEEIPQVEFFDLKSETWELTGVENDCKSYKCGASVEGKVYIVERDEICVYNPREGEGERLVHMVTKRLSEGGRKYKLNETVNYVCAVDDGLFAFFELNGIMWFDTKLNVWRRLVGPDGKRLKKLSNFSVEAMAEHDGKLVVLYICNTIEKDLTVTKSVECELVSLHRAGDRICGTIDWSGVVGTVPYSFRFLHFLALSD